MGFSTAEAHYSELAAALKHRISTIGDTAFRDRDPSAHLAELKAASEKIVALQKQLPAGTDPQLLHFLERCSFDKALAFVESHQS